MEDRNGPPSGLILMFLSAFLGAGLMIQYTNLGSFLSSFLHWWRPTRRISLAMCQKAMFRMNLWAGSMFRHVDNAMYRFMVGLGIIPTVAKSARFAKCRLSLGRCSSSASRCPRPALLVSSL